MQAGSQGGHGDDRARPWYLRGLRVARRGRSIPRGPAGAWDRLGPTVSYPRAAALAAFAALMAAVLVRAFHHTAPRDGFFALFMPVVVLAAYWGGREAGLLAVLLSGVTAWSVIFAPAQPIVPGPLVMQILAAYALVGVLLVEAAVRFRAAESAAHRLALLLQSSTDAMFTVSMDGTIQTWNHGAARLYGYPWAEAVGRPAAMLVPPERTAEVRAVLARVASGEHVDQHVTVQQRKDGARCDVSLTISPIRAASGKPTAAFAVARDISASVRNDQQLQAQADLLNLTYDAMFTWELNGGITHWYRGAEQLYGFSAEEAVGRRSHDLLQTVHPRGSAAFYEELVDTGRWEGEVRHVTRDGRTIVVDSRHVLTERDGRRFVLETNRDITERKLEEERRREQQEQERLLNDIAGAMSGETDLQRMLAALLEHLRPMLRFTGGSIILREGDELVLHAAVGPFSAAALRQRMPRGGGRIWDVIDRGEPFLSGDLLAEGLAPTTPLRSYLAVPLVRGRAAFGMVEVDSTETDAFDAAGVHLMQRVASILSGAIELALRYAAEAQATTDAEAAREAERTARETAERAADRVARLQRITAALSEAPLPEQVAVVAVDHGVRAVGAQAGMLSLLTPDGGSLALSRAIGYPAELVARWQRYPVSRYGATAEALRTGRVVWHASLDELRTRFPGNEPRPGVLAHGGRVVLPLRLGDRAVGVLHLTFREPRSLDADDCEYLLTLGGLYAQALERARLYAHEHQVAATLQEALLPSTSDLPETPGVHIDAAYHAGAPESDIGGDWYDAFRLQDGRLVLAIGDVAGRGLAAAVAMGQLRQAVRAAALEGSSPPEVLARVSRLLRLTYADQGMATAIVAIVDPLRMTLTYASAGHPGPIVATGERVESLPSGGPPLGFIDDRAAPSWTIALRAGTLIVLYTDGVIEARRAPGAGLEALCAAVEEQWRDRVAAARHAHAILRRLDVPDARDDLALITLALDAAPLDRVTLVVPAAPDSAALVRQTLHRLARTLALDDQGTVALLVASGEAVNNAIQHAYGAAAGTVELRARRDGDVLRVEVTDQGRWRPERPRGNGGRGITIMRALADAVEVVTTTTGTTIRLAFTLAGAAAGGAEHAGGAKAEDAERALADPATSAPADGMAIRAVDGTPVVDIVGDLDLTRLGRLAAVLDEAAAGSDGAVVVSLARTGYLDSQSIEALLRAGRRLTTSRRALLAVIPAGSLLRRVLGIAGVADAFALYDSVDEAVAAGARRGRAT